MCGLAEEETRIKCGALRRSLLFLGIDGQCKSAIRKKPRNMMPPADRLRAAHVRGTNRALNIRRAVARCRQHGDEKC